MGIDGGESLNINDYCSSEVKRTLENVDVSSLALKVATTFGVMSLAVSMIICPDRKLPRSLETEEVRVILNKAVIRNNLNRSFIHDTPADRIESINDILADLAQLVDEPLSSISSHKQAHEFVDR